MLELAQRLRSLNDDDLVGLLRDRAINTTNLRDFFDLAEVLLQTKNSQAWISSLNLDQLNWLLSKKPAISNPMDEIVRLVWNASDASVKTKTTSQSNPATITHSTQQTLSPLSQYVFGEVGIQIFLTCQYITELIFDMQKRRVKVVGKHAVASQDLKRIGEQMALTPEQIRDLVDLAAAADLVTAAQDRWSVCEGSKGWLTWDTAQKWMHLVTVWRDLVGEATLKVFSRRWSEISTSRIDDFMNGLYPLGSSDEFSKSQRIIRISQQIGLTVHGQANELFKLVIGGKLDSAHKLVTQSLPKTQNRLLVQADLSIVAPGPLSHEDEKQLRSFAETEQVGIASRYRLTALSISAALENGLTEQEIAHTLTRLSGAELPQPVDYLLKDTVKRFGRIAVTQLPEQSGSLVECAEPMMATQLLHEAALRAFGFKLGSEKILETRYDSELVYFGLRDAGYLAVRKNNTREDETLAQSEHMLTQISQLDRAKATVARLRDADQKVANSGDDEALLRRIQLAIKNKANVVVNYSGKDGKEWEFLLEPLSIANGRLRGRDRKADIERTLTITNITNLQLAQTRNREFE